MLASLAFLVAVTAGENAEAGNVHVIPSGPVKMLQHVWFEHGSAIVRSGDAPLLDAVAAAMRANPDILLLEVQGHAARNERRPYDLSRARADAVRAALVARGVAAERLVAHGFAAIKPACTEKTRDCLARNRRSEFLILRHDERATVVPRTQLLDCWSVTETGTMTVIKVGDEVCLSSTAFAVRDARGDLADGWLVSWTPIADGWRADVQGRDGSPLPVSFDCRLAEGTGLEIAGSGGFTKVKARRTSTPRAQAEASAAKVSESLRDCWRCLRDGRELVADGIVKDLLDEPFYSLRSCRGAMSAVRRAVAESRLPAVCKRP